MLMHPDYATVNHGQKPMEKTGYAIWMEGWGTLSLPLITGQIIGICEVMYAEEGGLQCIPVNVSVWYDAVGWIHVSCYRLIKESWLGINRSPNYMKTKTH